MVSGDGRSIELLTMTRLWLFRRSLHGLDRVRLPMPVPYRPIVYGVAVAVPWWAVLAWLSVPMVANGGAFLHFFVPGAATWALVKLVPEGAKPLDVVGSWARFVWHTARAGRRRGVGLRGRTVRACLPQVKVRER